MREITFLKRNADKWKEFETLLARKGKQDPDALAELFIRLTDDLSYAKTFYPKSKTTGYLNTLTAKVHGIIYRNKKEDRGKVLRFWKHDLPLLFYENRSFLLLSFIIFTVGICIGLLSASRDDGFTRLILGDEYVAMTKHNIASGSPMAVYASGDSFPMFIGITFNNIFVSFQAFAMGMLFSLGSGYIIFTNGVMVGAFEQMFINYGMLQRSILTISIHGIIELSSIIIAGGAGILLGKSFMMPGSYTRRDSFMKGAQSGIKMITGLVPLFIVAGFFESFVTRHTEMPFIVNILLILFLLLFILWYVIILPIKLHNKESHGNK